MRLAFGSDPGHPRVWSFRSMRQAAGAAHPLTGHTLHLMVSSLDGHRSHLNRDRTAVYSTSGISKSFLVKNSTRPVATAAGFLPGKSWLARGIDIVSISGIQCCSRSAPSKNTGNVSLPRIDSTGCRISFRPSVVIFQCCNGSEFDLKVRVDIGYRAVE